MKRRRGVFLGLSGVAVLSVAAAVGLGGDALRVQGLVVQDASEAGAAQRMTGVERDLARLRIAATEGRGDETIGRFSDLRSSLAAALTAETDAGRLAPQDIAYLGGLAHELDLLVVSGALHSGSVDDANRLHAHAEALGTITAMLSRLEAGRTARNALRLGQVSDRMLQSLIAMALALMLGASAMVLRPPQADGVDPARLEAERAAITQAARLSKARFVMMMSHELRTPLNGVLGLLSLMKESSPPDGMRPMILQAERAGTQLAAMLHDMLEVESADLDKPAPEAPAATFKPGALPQAMSDLFSPIAGIGGPTFTAEARGPMPEVATGDGVRFQRAVSHLCSHVMETAGVEDVALAVSHDGKECQAALSFDHKAGPEAGMRLVEPEAGTTEAGDENTGVGLGPLLARGLLEQMGGRLEIMTLDSGRIMVLAATPSEVVGDMMEAEARPRIRILAQTRSLDALGTAAARAAGVQVLGIDDAPEPDIVLVEAGGEEEEAVVENARRLWPHAMLMALGAPDKPALFHDSVAAPLEPARVVEAVDRAWAHCKEGLKQVPQPERVLRAG